MEIGLVDRNNEPVKNGDKVSLDGLMTADNSMGDLPNGFIFGEEDIFEVYYDEKIKNWSLKMGIEPNTPYNVKLLNHALGLFHDGQTLIIK
ncbi:MAG: hypothetical protein P4L31_07385 [Candidatus Babeliales bacterium]|nr:hypothetical protein [Candidatus Babeliales bacterium]